MKIKLLLAASGQQQDSNKTYHTPGLALFGFQGEEPELEETELVAQEEGSGSDNEEGGPGPP